MYKHNQLAHQKSEVKDDRSEATSALNENTSENSKIGEKDNLSDEAVAFNENAEAFAKKQGVRVHINEEVEVIPTVKNVEGKIEKLKVVVEKETNEKTRFKELNQEHQDNLKWKNLTNEEEDILMVEMKENEENHEQCRGAKLKEIQNFVDYKVFEEVEDEGQFVLGTRFVLTSKGDGSIKARFVVKGFQEDGYQSDSPTASRDTFKVFCTITANEKWKLTCSDVQAAFLQSELLDRDVFIQPPEGWRNEGKVW